MSLRNNLLLILVYLSVSGLIGCNNKNSKGTPPPPSCPNGQVATPAGCANAGTIAPPYGYIPPGNGQIQYFASKTDFITNRDTLIPSSKYSEFLRDALGVCNRCSTSVGSGLGEVVQCDSWLRGFNMLMISLGNNTISNSQVAFYSTPIVSQSYYSFAWQFPDIGEFFVSMFTGAPAPSCNQGQFSPYWATEASFDTGSVDGNGFSLYINRGPNLSRWYNHKLMLVVPTGKIGDPNFAFQLFVTDENSNKSILATGTLTRCQTPNCGMF